MTLYDQVFGLPKDLDLHLVSDICLIWAESPESWSMGLLKVSQALAVKNAVNKAKRTKLRHRLSDCRRYRVYYRRELSISECLVVDPRYRMSRVF